MHKKVTIKDVAREAGVSVATVSYVINNREDQKISPETRNKVLQMINLLNYRPNQAAKSLVTQKRQLIALYYKEHSSVLKRAEQLHFITQLSAFLYTKHYHLICLNQEYIGKYDVADVILTLEVTKEEFYKIGNSNFVPLIAIDSIIDDPLFFQINSDPHLLFNKASAYFAGEPFELVSLPIQNQEITQGLAQQFDNICWIHSICDIEGVSKGNILVIDDTVNHILNKHKNKLYLPSISEAKLLKLFQAIEWASKREAINNHNILV
ncbi:LacI family regulatory protein [Streptococcus equi subsp. zooepidemicus Sz35]|uniref:Transcriptional regulator LacI family n=3 Tax=Streptococcus equi subsp. zooepidemicus TaxID=40041 RepID=B4U478_STREM|nr:LacI family DNA-binding transcriptional regulator [Streptococcus equi]KIS16805.1 LacI family regulatory protein [Streptococcus equi subsp. zooepidemicus Sz4is]ACG62795.1 transcriptional regulator LacI family [Streptococcus equi subsp. zooepidemicus MGCS10565]EQB23285.1 LacI family regulatory protein [Streptococcus equi subsp. zooepidemicus SzS31A1]KIS05132.1 LacI family regulatory protein [Streptococcus equi subsp. zooepidemicus Sz12is]KIS18732.1 LacI family regulatory protein [Streptococcu